MGAGGKTSALRLLAGELSAAGGSVVATTTTAMLERELAAVGPLVVEADAARLVRAATDALAAAPAVGVAAARAPGGKVAGLPVTVVDALWEAHVADCVLVEADGSRGLPFKAFGPGEPVVPPAATTVVQVAGLQALGAPLTGAHVHRAERLAEALGLALGDEVTVDVFVRGLRLQLPALAGGRGGPGRRIATLLNGADTPAAEALGLAVADGLLDGTGDVGVVVLASLRERRAARVTACAA